MKKAALIDIIINDLQEVQSLISSFKDQDIISPNFMKLTRRKLASIEEEISLLEELDQLQSENNAPEVKKRHDVKPDNIVSLEKKEEMAIAESTLEEAKEEATPISESRETKPVSEKPIPIKESSAGKEITTPPQTQAEIETEAQQNIPETIITEHKEIENPIIEEEIIEEKSPVVEPKTTEKPTSTTDVKTPKSGILGESIKKEQTSVNERISINTENSESIKHLGSPVSDIRKAIGLNDRFYFQRELFNGNADLFNQTLDQLNAMESYEAATRFLQSNYNWGKENEVAASFLKSVKRLFL